MVTVSTIANGNSAGTACGTSTAREARTTNQVRVDFITEQGFHAAAQIFNTAKEYGGCGRAVLCDAADVASLHAQGVSRPVD